MFFFRNGFCVKGGSSKSEKSRVRSIVLLLLPLIFLACDEDPPAPNPSSSAPPLSLPSTGDPPVQETKEPQVFLSKDKKTVSLSVLNRTENLLRLSDQIIFSDNFPKIEESLSTDLASLSNFQEEEDLNMKISSFCSYEKKETVDSPSKPGKLVQELGGVSYHKQFSIFDLIPKEIFLSQKENQIFYCSFIFAFRNMSGAFDHYQIAQQPIEPFFVSDSLMGKDYASGNLALFRVSESGVFVPLGRDTVNTKNFSKVFIGHIGKEGEGRKVSHLGTEGIIHYHLFCDEMKETIVTSGLKSFIFIDIMMAVLREQEFLQTRDGPVNCRIFSEGRGRKITGLSHLFQMDFSDPKFQGINSVDSKDSPAVPLVYGTPPSQRAESSSSNGSEYQHLIYDENLLAKDSSRDKASQSVPELNIQPKDLFILNDKDEKTHQTDLIPLNSYFQFLIDRKESSADLPYQSFVDIKVETQCFNEKIFKESRDFSYREYVFPFRKSWPLMMVSFDQMFIMDSNRAMREQIINGQIKHFSKRQAFSLVNRTKDKWETHCTYNIQLVDRRTGQPMKNFPAARMARDIAWTVQSYGIHYRPLTEYPSISPVASTASRLGRKKKFLKLSDILANKAGYFHLTFPNTLGDSFFQIEGYKLTEMKVKCYTRRDENKQPVFEELSWPFSSSVQNNIYLKSLFGQDNKIRRFIETHKLTICRFMLYENDLMRYFSEELKMVGLP